MNSRIFLSGLCSICFCAMPMPISAMQQSDESSAVPKQREGLEQVGRNSQAVSGEIGKRQIAAQAAPALIETSRIKSRIENRVENRVDSRLDGNYEAQGPATSAFDDAKAFSRPSKELEPR